MDRNYLINIEQWVVDVNQVTCTNDSYWDSNHIDEILDCPKEKWIELSLLVLQEIQSIISRYAFYNLIGVLRIDLNKKRQYGSIIYQLDNSLVDKQITPPEIYLTHINNKGFITDIKMNSILLQINGYEDYTILYQEKWLYGIERWVWITKAIL